MTHPSDDQPRDAGKFGFRPDRQDPSAPLGAWDDEEDGNSYRDLGAPLTVNVRLERWNHRDEAEEVGSVSFDARAIFDAENLDFIRRQVVQYGDTDWVFGAALTAGLVEDHKGPFTVELPDDFDEYIEYRDEVGMQEPYETAGESLALAVVETNQGRRAEAFAAVAQLNSQVGMTEKKKVADLISGDVLTQHGQRLVVHSTSESSAQPGMTMVETDFGYLYLDPDEEMTVETANV